MTFDEAKKYFPTPEHVAPTPKEKPQPLVMDHDLSFNGVVGRPSLFMPTKLTNPNNKRVSVHMKIDGDGFYLRSGTAHIESTVDGANTADAFISFDPSRGGKTRGALKVVSGFTAEPGPETEQRIELEGTATVLEHLTPAPDSGAPREIPDLEKQPRGLTSRQQAKSDLDAASGLAETYREVVGAEEDAAGEMLRRIEDLTSVFGHRVEQWVNGELSANKEVERSVAWNALGKVVGEAFDKGFELLELGGVATKVAGYVADKAFEAIVDHVVADPQANDKSAGSNTAVESGTAAVASAAAHVTNRIAPLAVRLATTKSVVRQIASADAMQRQRFAQASLAEARPYEHEATAALMVKFREALARYNDAVRAIASAFTQLPTRLENSFDDLRMNYLKMRAHKSSDLTYRVQYYAAWDLGSEATNGRETLKVFEPVVSGYSGVSEEMREFIAHRKLSSFADDADVSVQLDCKQGGGVVIEKKVGKEPVFTALVGNAAIQAAIRSPQAVWKFLEEHVG